MKSRWLVLSALALVCSLFTAAMPSHPEWNGEPGGQYVMNFRSSGDGPCRPRFRQTSPSKWPSPGQDGS
jgi:hypothetical protein